MSITHHPDDSTLMSFAAGSLPGALAAVAAAHVAICPHCRDEIAVMELMGSALLAGLPGAPLLAPVPEAPDAARQATAPMGVPAPHGSGEVPAPLARLIGPDLDALRWRWVSHGLWLRHVPLASGGRLHLFKGAPGAIVAEHGHHGSELTMVLRGTLADSTGVYGPGDVCDLGEDVHHTPIAGADGCVCVVAQEHPVRWRGMLARLTRPWHGV